MIKITVKLKTIVIMKVNTEVLHTAYVIYSIVHLKKFLLFFIIHTNFLTMVSVSLFHCCEKVFTRMNICMIGKSSVKHGRYYWWRLHARKSVCNSSEINLGEHHDLYVQSHKLLLADVFNSFRNMCLKIYGLEPAHFFYGECEKTWRYQACNKGNKKELFGIRTNLSYKKIIFEKIY